MVNDDNLALNRLAFQFNPASFGTQTNRFAVVCRVYRTLGPYVTELPNETFQLHIGPPLAPGAFVRWRYDVKNPQVVLEERTEAYARRHQALRVSDGDHRPLLRPGGRQVRVRRVRGGRAQQGGRQLAQVTRQPPALPKGVDAPVTGSRARQPSGQGLGARLRYPG